MKAVRLTVMRTSVLCSLLGCTSTPAPQAQEFTHIVAFGDSFTDNGHIDGHGFNRDSNGKVWVEYLSDKLQAQDLDNRAWGGARTDDGHYLGFDWSGFNWQIDRFELQSKPEETLFTVWIGVNDYWDAKNDPADSVRNIKRGLEKLIAKKARHLVVFNNFDLTLSLGYGPKTEHHDLVPTVRVLTQKFNTGLYQMLFDGSNSFVQEHPGVKLYFVDIGAFMDAYVKKHDFAAAPWRGSYAFPDPEKYLWYDEWHPMTQCHFDIAEMVVPPQNLVDRTIVDVSALGVELAYEAEVVCRYDFAPTPIDSGPGPDAPIGAFTFTRAHRPMLRSAGHAPLYDLLDSSRPQRCHQAPTYRQQSATTTNTWQALRPEGGTEPHTTPIRNRVVGCGSGRSILPLTRGTEIRPQNPRPFSAWLSCGSRRQIGVFTSCPSPSPL